MDMRITYVVYLTDIDPDTGEVSQMKPVAYVDNEGYAKDISDMFNRNDCDDPNRTYRYQQL